MEQETIDGWMREAYGYHQAGDMARAEPIYRRIIQHQASNADAWFLLGEIEALRGNNARAAELIGHAVSCNGAEPHFHYALGCALQADDPEGAAEAYRRALSLDAAHAGAHLNLGCLLQERAEMRAAAAAPQAVQRELDEAQSHFRAASELAPNHPGPWMNLGYAMERERRQEEALAYFERALAADAGLAEAHFNRSLALLALGRWRDGWPEYEWRWQASGFPRPQFGRPEWDGSPLDGKTLLLYTEQGFGDAIQFVRFTTEAALRGARVVLRCAPELESLLGGVAGVSETIRADDPLPEFDAHCSLLSLPRLLNVIREGRAARVPYLRAPDDRLQRWGSVIKSGEGELRVGLVWASQPMATQIAPRKSIALDALAPLSTVRGVRFYSLQMGEAGRQGARPDSPLKITDLTAGIRDFADTAAVIANLDLTLSVDTAVAHLAGAMGRPVWTLLNYAPDWRWYPDAPTTFWYPSMRLYRQARRSDWARVIQRVADDLPAMRARLLARYNEQ